MNSNNMKKTISRIFSAKWFRWFLIAFFVLVLALIFIKPSENFENVISVSRGDLIQEVSVSGRVAPANNVTLAFEKGGAIGSVRVKVSDKVKKGDILATLESGEVTADYNSFYNKVLIEKENLAVLERGLRAEELAVEESKLTSAKIAFTNAQNSLNGALGEVYSKIDQAMRAEIDQFFDYPESVNPKFIVNTSIKNAERIRDEKISAEISLKDLNKYNSSSTGLKNIENGISMGQQAIDKSIVLINSISKIVSESYNDSNQDQFKVDVSDAQSLIASSRTSFTSALNTYQNTKKSLDLATDEYVLKKSGASEEDIRSQLLKIAQAEADFQKISSQLEKSRLRSPIDGIVTKVEPKVGEIFSAGKEAFVIISEGKLQSELFVPEADIAKVRVGNLAHVTLDAYGPNEKFEGEIIAIDPAETIDDGISTYKVTLQFSTEDPRLRPGMTANVDIITNTKENVLKVPFTYIKQKDGKNIITRLLDDGSLLDIPVEIGLRGSNGEVEIVSGINDDFADSTISIVIPK
jgi:HlyD family secretion protein